MNVLTKQDDHGLIEDEFDAEAERRMFFCDQCGPSVLAKMHGILGDGELKWCTHCATVNAPRFNAAGGFLYELLA